MSDPTTVSATLTVKVGNTEKTFTVDSSTNTTGWQVAKDNVSALRAEAHQWANDHIPPSLAALRGEVRERYR